jgi:cell fate regulator YaaT (PSP1 superfamily)
MPKVVEVRFKRAGKIYYFDATGFEDLKADEYVVVDTARGRALGRVVAPPQEVSEPSEHLKTIERRATPLDLSERERHRLQEREALERCRGKVTEHGLEMKLVKTEYNFDGSRLVVYFTAEKRVDFRELIRDLARSLKTKVELRQVGVRDEAKLLGGLGRCGRILCCATHLCQFSPISIKMARLQGVSLSPAEISGVCGRLLCCLAYENETYRSLKEKFPKVGTMVETPYGVGKVKSVNVLKEMLEVELKSEVTVEVSAGELKERG